MDLLGLLVLTTLTGFQPVQDTSDFPGSDVWMEAWRELDTLARSAPGSVDRRRIAAGLDSFQARHERSARKRHDRPEAFRSRVLGAQLARLADAPFRPVSDPGVPIAWLPGEGWIAAQVAGPGPTRVAAIEAALADALPRELGERVQFAFALATADARDLRLAESHQVARALHARVQAASKGDLPAEHRSGAKATGLLAFVSRMRGEHAEAMTILEHQLESTPDPIDRRHLLVEVGRTRLAAGQDASARRDLGEALALGSSDAGWLLGRSALSEEAIFRARALFRSLVSSPEEGLTPTSGLRGYGLSLLTGAESTVLSTRNLPDHPR